MSQTSVEIIAITEVSARPIRRKLQSTGGVSIDYKVSIADASVKAAAETKMESMESAPTTDAGMAKIVAVVATEANVAASDITPEAAAVTASEETPGGEQTAGGFQLVRTPAAMAVSATIAASFALLTHVH